MISLVLITSALASCHKEPVNTNEQKVYMRSDSTAQYSHAHYNNGGVSPLLWYYAFRPYGYHNGMGYNHVGYYSNGISQNSNTGFNTTKTSHSSSTSRGGFGHSSFHVSS